ncbi:tetratricopeptide (TPR) repeat protein [Bradyrhizobium sp. USDA 3686]|uniref:glycosyltransferase family 9 protein n=1 Tax=Bradyrhizobium canariense TaxID=255045 RepID=UPI00195D48E9|nr:tetratricopeptide repeat protein [Bradyrhizobium canariense]MBM7483326.1 tetratricopeptide (TPR) repeat protein [Bradyrhizobium canariense]
MNVERYRAFAARLVRNPNDPVALVEQFANISEARVNGRHYLPIARRAYEIAPNDLSPVFNYASALHRAGEFGKAKDLYLRCLKMADLDWMPKVLHHCGVAYRALDENEKAADYYQQAYDLDPNPEYLKDRALALLAAGKLYDGLKAYEVRRECAARKLEKNGGKLVSQQKLPDGAQHWQGQDLNGKTIVVYHEEGSGDFIQFCRFIPKLRALGAASIFICGPVPNLLDLVADNIAVDGIVPLSGPFDCDYVIGSMSLPWRCGVDYSEVHGRPYFKAEPAQIPLRGKLNVGLVWRGNPDYGQDVHRSMAFTEFCPLFDMPDVAFYSLQAGAPSLEVTQLGLDGFVANLEPLAQSWRDTARLIQALDAVVSVDTAVAHLAGALGKPVFILTTNASDWRWDRRSRKTDWYDSASVIRQKRQDEWWPCINLVRAGLKWMIENERRRVA